MGWCVASIKGGPSFRFRFFFYCKQNNSNNATQKKTEQKLNFDSQVRFVYNSLIFYSQILFTVFRFMAWIAIWSLLEWFTLCCCISILCIQRCCYLFIHTHRLPVCMCSYIHRFIYVVLHSQFFFCTVYVFFTLKLPCYKNAFSLCVLFFCIIHSSSLNMRRNQMRSHCHTNGSKHIEAKTWLNCNGICLHAEEAVFVCTFDMCSVHNNEKICWFLNYCRSGYDSFVTFSFTFALHYTVT